MNNKKGFSLLSFLLYLVLFTMIMFFSCHIIVSLIIPSLSSMRTCQSIIALHIASDLFVRDVRAINHESHWKLITPHELVWRTGDHDIGWSFSHNRLERREGVYDEHWKNATTSVVAAGIAQGTFTVEKHKGHVIGIEIALKPIVAIKKPIICYVAVPQKGTL